MAFRKNQKPTTSKDIPLPGKVTVELSQSPKEARMCEVQPQINHSLYLPPFSSYGGNEIERLAAG